MKLRYVGPSFGVDSLTNGMIYEVTEDNGMYRVIDDSGEDYLYSMTNPAPLDGSSPGGRWEMVDDSTLEHESKMALEALRWIISTIASNEERAQRAAANANDLLSQGRAEAYQEVMAIMQKGLGDFDIQILKEKAK